MFPKLHKKLTLLSAAITSLIMIIMTLCLAFVSETNQWENSFLSFQGEMNTFVSGLQEAKILSHTWLNRMEGSKYIIRILDNGKPLLFNELEQSAPITDLFDEVLLYYNDNFPEKSSVSNLHSFHTEFPFLAGNPGEAGIKNCDYFVSGISLLKNNAPLTVLVLAPQNGLRYSLIRQRILFLILAFTSIIVLTVFCWFFTKKILTPLKINQENQIRFVSYASHELRTPLSVILSSAAACEIAPSGEQAVFFSNIKQEGKRMQNLLQDMLFLARGTQKEGNYLFLPVDPDTLLLNAFESFQLLARDKQITMSIHLPDEESPVCCWDENKIFQALSILLQNAVSYTESGGTIVLSLYEDLRHMNLSVTDTGCGIPDSERSLIFERFYRTENSHNDKNHFGLGLCIAKEIITAHKGNIQVTANMPKGSVFTIVLPKTI